MRMDVKLVGKDHRIWGLR